MALLQNKGDANDVDDPMLVNSNQLIGKLRFAIPMQDISSHLPEQQKE